MMQPNKLLTIDEAARYLNVSKMSLRRWTNSGRLRCHRIGIRGERRFAVVDLELFLRGTLAGVLRTGATAADDSLAALEATGGGVRHVCSHFHDTGEAWRLFLPYFRYHAERAAPIFYIYDTTSREQFCANVAAAGWDPGDLMDRGLLELVPSSEAYLPTGSFSASGMLAFVAGVITSVRARGHSTMLVSGEMTWSLGDVPGADAMMVYEERLNDLLLAYPDVTIVCHYSTECFGSKVTLEALRAHPCVQLSTGLYRGLYSRPPIATSPTCESR